MAQENDDPQRLEIRKYPNRRYYDSTRSKHLSLQQIHKLIIEGNNVRVTDAKSGEEITSKVLTQILLEYEPVKLDLFSTELLTQAIRVNDQLLKDFVDVYFREAFEAFCSSQKQVDQMLRQAHQLRSVLPAPTGWAGSFLPPWMQRPVETSASAPRPEGDGGSSPSGMRDEIAALRKEVSTLKTKLRKGGLPPRQAKKA